MTSLRVDPVFAVDCVLVAIGRTHVAEAHFLPIYLSVDLAVDQSYLSV